MLNQLNSTFEEFAMGYDLHFYHIAEQSYLWFYDKKKIYCDFQNNFFAVGDNENKTHSFSNWDHLVDFIDFQF